MKLAVAFRIGFAALLLAAIVASLVFLPVQEDIKWSLERIRSLGPWGPVLFVALYVLVCLLFLPGSALTLAGGFMFGAAKGIAAASLVQLWGPRPRFLSAARSAGNGLNAG